MQKSMTAQEIMDTLQWVDPDLPIFIWIDGNRYKIDNVDIIDDTTVDITADVGTYK